MSEVKIIFLGTGGGRYMISTQRRGTGGIRILSDELNLHLDPGPGALIRSIENKLSPTRVNTVLISHAHLDHYADAEAIIEAMTGGALKKKGSLIASRSVLFGNEVCDVAVSRYHQGLPASVIEVRVDEAASLGEVGEVLATRAVHGDPDAVGFRFRLKGYGDIGYTSDTEYYEGVARYYDGVRILILCTLRPKDSPWKFHMSTLDAVKIAEECKPELAILTHFGGKMLASNPFKEARFVEQKTGVKTIAATDFMRISLGEEVSITSIR